MIEHLASASAAHPQAQARPESRLVKAAHEFEAQMMKELFKPMTASDPLTGDETESASGSGGALAEFATEALAQAMSNAGGFGIANRIVGELSGTGNHGTTVPVTAYLHHNTG